MKGSSWRRLEKSKHVLRNLHEVYMLNTVCLLHLSNTWI